VKIKENFAIVIAYNASSTSEIYWQKPIFHGNFLKLNGGG